MKRYRTIQTTFDSRSNILNMKIEDDWDEKIKEQWKNNKKEIRDSLQQEFGIINYPEKEKNFLEMGPTFPSIIAFHNKFLNQARNAFVIGSYYPALTAITTLTERVLNHLIIMLRGEYKSSDKYKKVRDKESFTDWDFMIETLESWDVLLPETKPYLKRLKELRHEYAAHFNAETDTKDRELALEAIKIFQEFIRIQFGFFGTQPWFIQTTRGAFFIKKEYETNPFIKKIYLPNCILVGPNYKLKHVGGGHFELESDENYENKEINDEEFVKLFENKS